MFTFSNTSQLSLFDIYSEICELSYQKPSSFLELLKKHFDLPTFIPEPFRIKYYKWLGRNRKISLESTLAALLIMHLLKIPGPSLLCTFLCFSSELRNYCLIDQVPHESHFSRFKNSSLMKSRISLITLSLMCFLSAMSLMIPLIIIIP